MAFTEDQIQRQPFTEDEIERQLELVKAGKPPVPGKEPYEIALQKMSEAVSWSVYRGGEPDPASTLRVRVRENNLNPQLREFANLWRKYYHGKATDQDMVAVIDRLGNYEAHPKEYLISSEVKKSIQSAIRVFGPGKDKDGNTKPGDKIQAPKDFLDFLGVTDGDRWTAELIKRVVTLTAVVETSLRPEQKIQMGSGPAISQWQVEPVTALDLVTNSKTLFGEKFEAEFRDGSKMHDGTARSYQKNGMSVRDSITPTHSQGLLDLSLGSSPVGVGESRERDMSNILLKDPQLAATLSMGKWLQATQVIR